MAETSIRPPQGFVNLDKPAGMTSRRAAETAARCFGRKLTAGHAGTLDPAATGVLPVAIGGATRLTELLAEEDKEYRGAVRLGLTTDTDDAEGRALGEERPVGVSRAEVEEALASFRGEILQRPPDFSAIKRRGQAAHKLARRGESPGLEPRPAVYRELELLSFEPPDVKVRALVAKGTYIRALARDLGEKLGCGGHLASLVRTRAGSFALSDAVGLDELRALAAEGRAEERLLPAREALSDFACLTADGPLVRHVKRGQALPLSEFAAEGPAPGAGARCLVVEPSGRALSLAELVSAGDGTVLVQPRKRIR
jgi:tRNA pseudouridine55 synthase